MIIRHKGLLYRLLYRLPLWLPFDLMPARLGNRMDLLSEVKLRRAWWRNPHRDYMKP